MSSIHRMFHLVEEPTTDIVPQIRRTALGILREPVFSGRPGRLWNMESGPIQQNAYIQPQRRNDKIIEQKKNKKADDQRKQLQFERQLPLDTIVADSRQAYVGRMHKNILPTEIDGNAPRLTRMMKTKQARLLVDPLVHDHIHKDYISMERTVYDRNHDKMGLDATESTER